MTFARSTDAHRARARLPRARLLTIGLGALALGLLASALRSAASAPEGRVIVLGFDGASHGTTRDMIAAGKLPNLARLAERGSFEPLGTTHNAESAVAWAALNTGQNPSKTGIPGFIQRDLIGPEGKPVPSGGTPSPGIAYQVREDRRVADLPAGFPIGLLARWDAPWLAAGSALGVLLLFLVAFRLLLRVRALPSLLLSVLLGAVAGVGAYVAKGYVPEVVPQVVGNPLAVPPFWEVAARHGVKSVVLDAAMSWDREPVEGARVLAGLGLPDSRGSNGDWFIYTTSDYAFDRPPKGRSKDPSGTIFRVDWRDDRIETALYGPFDFYASHRVEQELAKLRKELERDGIGWKKGEELRKLEAELEAEQKRLAEVRVHVPMIVEKLPQGGVRLTIGTQSQDIPPGSWSDYYHVEFELNPLIKVRAITRARVLEEEPFRLFVNTLDIDPASPPFWQPISQPPSYSRELVHRLHSPFESFGWACATMPFKANEIDAMVLLEDIEFTLKWRERLLHAELDRGDWQLLMWVDSTPDRVQHMLYQYHDPEHPLFDAEAAAREVDFFGRKVKLGDAIPAIYQEMDRVVGEVMAKLRPEDTLLICADHGFQSFRHQFHVNNWLAKKGYLSLRPGVTNRDRQLLQYVDWSKTQAYSLGFGVVYLNIAGRERDGIVPPGEADALMRRIGTDLLGATDDRPGRETVKAIDEVTYFKDVHHGPFVDREGDIMIGFAPYYRVSWATTMGDIRLEKDADGAWQVGGVCEPNENPWSGDHVSVAPSNVPGIFFASRKVQVPEGGTHLLDVASTALSLLGVPVPAELDRPALRMQ